MKKRLEGKRGHTTQLNFQVYESQHEIAFTQMSNWQITFVHFRERRETAFLVTLNKVFSKIEAFIRTSNKDKG